MKTINKIRPERLQKTNVVTALWSAVLSILLLASSSLFAENRACQASNNSKSVYNDFRNKFPFHFQAVGLAEYPDNSCLFLIAEPTPDVTEEGIRQVFSQYDYYLDIKKHKLGYDGYIKDVLIVVRSISHGQTIQLEKKLHKLLYASDYKAERATLELPVKKGKAFFSKGNINYKISLAELNDWFITKNELFFDAQGQKFGVKSLLNSTQSGVYLSEKPGFVAWVINKNDNLYQKKSDIRQFALDSDLLLGAFSNTKKLIIIGRERQAGSLQEIQPLCIETILMLAACRNSSLSQSLDMNDLLAGKVQGRNYDWCPTYLSDILKNTEYGDLLTINDVLLKGWSESGKLQFFDVKYPSPKTYPFKKPLSDQVLSPDGQKCIVYNWNTTDAVYSMRMSDYSIYALSNTGALPISYFKDQNSNVSLGESYEKKAYQYFAEINNTDLARAVQYSFLYSVFYDNNIFNHTTYTTKRSSSLKPYLLEGKVRTLLNNIRNTSSSEIINIAQTLSRERLKDSIEAVRNKTKADFDILIRNEIKNYGVSANDPRVIEWKKENWSLMEVELNKVIQQAIKEDAKLVEGVVLPLTKEIQTTLKSMNATEFSQSCKYLSYPRGEEVALLGENPKIRKLAKNLYELTMMQGIYNDIYKPFGIEISEVMDYYSRTLRNEESAWIKTPTLTRTHLGNNFVGGHNITALIKRVPPIASHLLKEDRLINKKVIRDRAVVIAQTTRLHRGL